MHPKTPGTLLEAPDGIPALMAQARRVLGLREMLSGLLPDAIRRSCSIANYKAGKIVVFTANSAVAAKLKLLSPKLCGELAQRGVEVTGMEIVVQPLEPATAAQHAAGPPSARGAGALQQLAEQLPDSGLKRAVDRLAGRR